jgi:hypothetical protein
VRFTIPEASLPLWPFRPLEDVRSPTGEFDKGVMERNVDEGEDECGGCSTVQENSIYYNTVQSNATQHTTQYNTQHNTTQHNSIQHNATQHNTTQKLMYQAHSTAASLPLNCTGSVRTLSEQPLYRLIEGGHGGRNRDSALKKGLRCRVGY